MPQFSDSSIKTMTWKEPDGLSPTRAWETDNSSTKESTLKIMFLSKCLLFKKCLIYMWLSFKNDSFTKKLCFLIQERLCCIKEFWMMLNEIILSFHVIYSCCCCFLLLLFRVLELLESGLTCWSRRFSTLTVHSLPCPLMVS